MNKRNWVTHALFLGLIAIAILQVLLYRQVRSLEQRLDREERRARREASVDPPRTPPAESPAPDPVPVQAPTARRPASVPAPATESPTAEPPGTTPAELEEMVRKVVREEQAKSPSPRVISYSWKDPMTVMKEELKLSPSQEARIQDLRRARQEWHRELARQYKEDPNPDPAEFGRAKREYQVAYRDALRRELDLTQQKRFDELIAEGRLPEFGGGGNGTIMITTESVTSPADKK